MQNKALTMLAVGDLIFDSPEASTLAQYVEPTLATGDVVVGQLEVLYTDRGARQYVEVPAPPCKVQDFKYVAGAHFNVLTLAGNHIWDSGAPGIEDTIELLKKNNIVYTGGGRTLDEARKPCIIEKKGVKIGYLAYNCAGPKDSWATPAKPGCAYVNVITHYEPSHTTPESPARVYSMVDPDSLRGVLADVKKLRPDCDLLIVSLHKGRVHTPAILDMYEQPLCYSILDAGADLILGGHAHILKGIEFYKGKPIFHGMGNFITVTSALTIGSNWNLAQWIEKRKKMFGFEPDPEYPNYAFHPEGKQIILAKFIIENKKIAKISYFPGMVNKKGQPEIYKQNDEKGRQVFEYMDKITRQAGLNAKFEWSGDEVIVYE